MRRQQVLDTAKDIVCTGDRQLNYGKPEDNFKNIAALWSDYLHRPISSTDVGLMMILMKVARLMKTPQHSDSYVDIAGYAACTAEIATAHEGMFGEQLELPLTFPKEAV